ncbi:hypothetical protein AB6C66_02740, partial [Vibrio splendidus]
RVWLALVLLCRVAASFNKQLYRGEHGSSLAFHKRQLDQPIEVHINTIMVTEVINVRLTSSSN